MGTPGRLDDLISTGKLSLSQVRFLVLDECVCTTHWEYLNNSLSFIKSIALSLLAKNGQCFLKCVQNNSQSHRSIYVCPSGWPPVCRLYRLYQQNPQTNPSGHLWWQETAGNTLEWIVYVTINISVTQLETPLNRTSSHAQSREVGMNRMTYLNALWCWLASKARITLILFPQSLVHGLRCLGQKYLGHVQVHFS